MNPKQRKYTIISAIFASLALISAVVSLAMVFGIDLSESTDTTLAAENPFALIAFVVAGFAIILAIGIILFFGAMTMGGFSLVAYKCADIAVKSETDEKKHALPRILYVVSVIELAIAVLTILFVLFIVFAALVA